MNRRYLKSIAFITVIAMCLALCIPIAFAKPKTPVAPSDIKAVAQSYTTVKISWEKVGSVAGYEVYRATSLKGLYKRIARVTGTTYTNKKLSANKTYYYKVNAYAKSGRQRVYSKYSEKVKVTTPKGLMAYYKSIQGSSLSKSKQNKLNVKTDSIIKKIIKNGMTEVEKANAIYNYILDNVSYEDRGWWVNNANHAYGALINGKAQCSGYSRAMVMLCAKAGIECLYVVHKNSSESGHKWNMIKIDGQYYHIDLQYIDMDDSGGMDPVVLHDITWWLWGDSNMDKEVYKWDTKKYPKCPEAYRPENR